MNKIIFFLSTLLVLVFFSCSSGYDNPADFEIEFSANGRTCKTTQYVGRNFYSINVPPRINGKSVTEIGLNTFADLEMASITIPDSIKKIDDYSFSGNFLRNFIIPRKVKEIGIGAFMFNELSHIVIPKSVRKIGYRAFCNNPLKSITIGSNVEFGELSGIDIENKEWKYTAFEGTGFDEAYQEHGRRAGVYTLTGGIWRFAPR